MKTKKQCQVVIFYLDKCGIPKECVLPQKMSAKEAIALGDKIRELQKQVLNIGFSTGVKINESLYHRSNTSKQAK